MTELEKRTVTVLMRADADLCGLLEEAGYEDIVDISRPHPAYTTRGEIWSLVEEIKGRKA